MRPTPATLSTTETRATTARQLSWAGAVMAVAVLSAYVCTVNESVSRGESQRQAQRALDNNRIARAHRGAHPRGAPDPQFAFITAP